MQEEVYRYYDKRTQAARVRCRLKWYEQGERSSSYFFSLEKVHGANKTWKTIKCQDGTYSNDINIILKEQVEFYKTLFSSEGWNEIEADLLVSNISTELSKYEMESCENSPTENEIHKAVMNLKSNKSPGIDGILAEFYQIHWNTIKTEFIQVIDEIFSNNEMSTSQYRGVITLMYKKGERENLANWRPLTLLTSDYKIITKVL